MGAAAARMKDVFPAIISCFHIEGFGEWGRVLVAPLLSCQTKKGV